MQKPYTTADGKPMLRHSVAAFIDILGYREYIRESFKAGKAQEELNRLREAIDEAYGDLKRIAKPPTDGGLTHFEVRTFTDNLVIGFPIKDNRTTAGDITTVIFYLACLQGQLAKVGYFIRGAIAVGELYIDDNIVFGPALMEAYEGEHKIAVFPRIILCTSATQVYRDEPRWRETAHGLLCDSDNQVFIDYLDETVMIAFPDARPFTEFTDGHKVSLVAKLAEFRGNPHVRAKYEWAANYHNSFCGRFPEVYGEGDKIPIDLLLASPKPWKPHPSPLES